MNKYENGGKRKQKITLMIQQIKIRGEEGDKMITQ